MPTAFLVDKINASTKSSLKHKELDIPDKENKLNGINNMQEYNLIIINKIGEVLSTRYTLTIL